MTTSFSARAQAIESFKVMDLLKHANALAASGRDIIHLGAGEPDFGAAPAVIEKARSSLENRALTYTPAGGIQPLREKIAEFHFQRYGQRIRAEQVMVTAGASAGLLLAFALRIERDKDVLMADPGYPCNRQFLRVIEAQAKPIPVDVSNNYQLTASQIEDYWDENSAGVLVASPANPTGSVLSTEELRAVSHSVTRLGGALIVDEIYHGLTYETETTSIVGINPDAIALNSFSKYFGMTGWRLGWMVSNEGAINELEKIAQNLFISPPTLSQYAALECFTDSSLALYEERRWILKERRDRLMQGLIALGFKVPKTPEGAFYIYADASELTDDSFEWCWRLLNEAGVVATPGADFGSYHPERFVRFAYTTSLAQIDQALERIAQFVAA